MAVPSSGTEADKVEDVKVDAVEEVASADANDAAKSSGADDSRNEGAKEPKSVLDAVKAALKKSPVEKSPAPKGEKESAEAADDAAKPEGDAAKDGDKAEAEEKLPFHKHPAWQKHLAKERDLTAQVDQLRPKAERYDQMQSMVQRANLVKEEVDAGFNIMAAMKGDPHKALDLLTPYYNALLEVTGRGALPKDLRERVDAGRVTEEDAREMARTRAEAAAANKRAESVTVQSRQEAAAAVTNDIIAGVSEWENAWKARDPDYPNKQPLVEARVNLLAQQKPPRNRAEALELCKQAQEQVEKSLKPFVPKKEAVKPSPDGSSVKTTRAPKSSLEAAQAALARVR